MLQKKNLKKTVSFYSLTCNNLKVDPNVKSKVLCCLLVYTNLKVYWKHCKKNDILCQHTVCRSTSVQHYHIVL